MRRQTSYRRTAAELPAFGTLATTRSGEVGEVIAHEDGQARLQFAGHVQGLYSPDEITWQHVGAQTEGKWQTEGSELHLADRDYPELSEILTKPAPAIVQEGNEWGRVASKTADQAYSYSPGDWTSWDRSSTPDFVTKKRAHDAGAHANHPEEGCPACTTTAAKQYSCDNPNCKDTGPLNPEPGGGNMIGRCPSCNSRCWAGSSSSGGRPIKASKTAADEVDVFGYPFSREQAQKLHDYLAVDVAFKLIKKHQGSKVASPPHTDRICPGSGKVQNSGGRCEVCDKPVGGWETKDGMVRKWHSASKTADGPGYTETVYDPFNAFTPKAGECPTCFGEGAFSELLPSGKGFGPEHECSDCGGTGRAS
jgi:hypothetical protein